MHFSLYDLADAAPTLAESYRRILEDEDTAAGDWPTMMGMAKHEREAAVAGLIRDRLNGAAASYAAFARGFAAAAGDLVTARHLRPDQLALILQGEALLNFAEARANARYPDVTTVAGVRHQFTPSTPAVVWLWEFLEGPETTERDRQDFLFYVTGSDRAPAGGLRNLEKPITIAPFRGTLEQSEVIDSKIGVAHTCFNTLELPNFRTKEALVKSMRTLIKVARHSSYAFA